MADSLIDGIAVVNTVRTTLATLETTMRTTAPTLSDPGAVYDALTKARAAIDMLGDTMARHPDATSDLVPLGML